MKTFAQRLGNRRHSAENEGGIGRWAIPTSTKYQLNARKALPNISSGAHAITCLHMPQAWNVLWERECVMVMGLAYAKAWGEMGDQHGGQPGGQFGWAMGRILLTVSQNLLPSRLCGEAAFPDAPPCLVLTYLCMGCILQIKWKHLEERPSFILIY